MSELTGMFYFTATGKSHGHRNWEMLWAGRSYTVRERLAPGAPAYIVKTVNADNEESHVGEANGWDGAMSAVERHIRADADKRGVNPAHEATEARRHIQPKPHDHRLQFTPQVYGQNASILLAEDKTTAFSIVTGPAPTLDGEGAFYRVYASELTPGAKPVQIAFTDNRQDAEHAARTHQSHNAKRS